MGLYSFVDAADGTKEPVKFAAWSFEFLAR